MKALVMSFVMVLALSHNAAAACSILNEEKVQIGSYKGVKGICSNNEQPITCILMESVGIKCTGPSGGYTGSDLDSLIISACGCSAGQEKEQQFKKELQKE
jgi:hypothetical protein